MQWSRWCQARICVSSAYACQVLPGIWHAASEEVVIHLQHLALHKKQMLLMVQMSHMYGYDTGSGHMCALIMSCAAQLCLTSQGHATLHFHCNANAFAK